MSIKVFTNFRIILMVLFLSSCQTSEPKLELWDDPGKLEKDQNTNKPVGQIEPEDDIQLEMTEDTTWVPEEIKVVEDQDEGLLFEQDSIKNGPKQKRNMVNQAFKEESGVDKLGIEGRKNQIYSVISIKDKVNVYNKPDGKILGYLLKNKKFRARYIDSHWAQIGKNNYVKIADIKKIK